MLITEIGFRELYCSLLHREITVDFDFKTVSRFVLTRTESLDFLLGLEMG